MPGKGSTLPLNEGGRPARAIAGMEPDPVTRRLIELYLTPLGYTVHWIARPEDWTGEHSAVTAFLLGGSAPPALDLARLHAFAERLGAVPLLGMAGDPRRFPEGSVPQPVRQVLRKPVRADALLAALEALHVPAAGGAAACLAEFDAMVRELEMDAATVIDLCQSFLERGAQYLRDLRAAADPRDDATLDRVAHGFKGMAGNLRFRRMTELSDQLRKTAKAQSDDPAPLIRDMAAEFDALRKVLEERWLKNGSAQAGKNG